MKRISIFIITASLAVFLFKSPVDAHPGNTASDGCHYCRTNCDKWGVPWNERHCHGGSSYNPPPVVEQPVQQYQQPIYPTSTSYEIVVYPTSTPKPKPTSTPKPTLTPFPTITATPSPTSIPTLTLIPSPTATTPLSNTLQGQVEGVSTKKEDSFLSELFKNIFNLLTFNLFASKNQTIISPIAIATPTVTVTNSPTPSVLGETANLTINPDELVEVVSVVDGDTIKVKLNNKTETIRLIGIDTPEVVDPRKPVQCFGKEASSKAKELLSGHKVKLENDPTQGERDKYERLLRYVWREDGLFFNDWMIRNGYAHEYTYNLSYKYQSQFKEAERYARENNLGLWNPDICK